MDGPHGRPDRRRSAYWPTDTVDAGPIAAQDYCFVRPGDTASTLWRRELFPMGVRLVRSVLADLEEGTVVADPQDERCATWEPSMERAPLHRPELPELGAMPAGYRLERRRAPRRCSSPSLGNSLFGLAFAQVSEHCCCSGTNRTNHKENHHEQVHRHHHHDRGPPG